MKNKTTLLLIEQAVLLVVFALAAAVCLRLFAWADTTSRLDAAKDQALLQAQNVAETLKNTRSLELAAQSYGVQGEESGWEITFDQDWNQTPAGPYTLRVTPQSQSVPLLAGAMVTVTDEKGNVLAQLSPCWQEDGL